MATTKGTLARRHWLTELRERSGLSAHDLAKKVGVSRQMVYYYEHGTHVPARGPAYALLDLAHQVGLELRLEDIIPRP